MLKNKFILCLFLILIFITGCSNNRDISFDKKIELNMKKAGKPGMAVLVIDKGEIESKNYYGIKDKSKNLKVDENTIFNIGSVSKLFVAVSIMQLVEKGKIDLDKDVSEYAGFKIENPYYPQEKISVRMLLTHTSTIDNNWGRVMYKQLKEGDSKIGLDEFVEEYLKNGGKYYSKKNFIKKRPKENYFSYSNPAICLAAYIVEKVSGEEIESYVRKNILEPLEMKNSSFFYRNLKMENIAMPYSRFLGIYFPKGYYSGPFYPAGFMKSTVVDMGNFMIMVSKKGKFKERVILGEKYFEEMIKIDSSVKPDDWDNQGLVFQHKSANGVHLIGHSGGLFGIAAIFYYSQEEERGVILLMNGGWKNFFDGNRMNEKEIREIFFMFYKKSNIFF